MTKVTPLEDKDFADRKPYFDAGVHEVYIQSAKRGKSTNTGSEFIEVEVLGSEDETDNIRLYLTEKTEQRTRQILATIAVHNKDSDAEKEKVREAFKKITDTDQLDDKFLEKFKDMQAWILTAEDLGSPKTNGGYFLRSQLYSYQPKPRATTSSDGSVTSADGSLTKDDLNEIPF